jgi:hypothetical protein
MRLTRQRSPAAHTAWPPAGPTSYRRACPHSSEVDSAKVAGKDAARLALIAAPLTRLTAGTPHRFLRAYPICAGWGLPRRFLRRMPSALSVPGPTDSTLFSPAETDTHYAPEFSAAAHPEPVCHRAAAWRWPLKRKLSCEATESTTIFYDHDLKGTYRHSAVRVVAWSQ